MTDETGVDGPDEDRRAKGSMRRKIYIKERLPAVAAEMKALSDEKRDLGAKRKDADSDERKQLNRRWNFIVERLDVLRRERAELIGERDGIPAQAGSEKANAT